MVDCTDYSKCPKNFTADKTLDYEKDSFRFLFLGCWGVYCSGKGTEIQGYDKKKNFFKEDKKSQYGQKQVVDSMVKFSEKVEQDAVILAGDNVYNDIFPTKEVINAIIKAGQELKKVEDDEQIQKIVNFFLNSIGNISEDEKVSRKVIIELLKKINDDHIAVNEKIKTVFKEAKSQLYNMEKQLHEGFEKCMLKVHAKNFFIGVGNHDIESCDVINKQLNYKKWTMPALSYNVLVKMNGFDVNLIFIDTNMYDTTWCLGDYPTTAQQDQEKWFKGVLSEEAWNIVIGHVPFACNPHKKTDGKIATRITEGLLQLIAKNTHKIDLYMCADEHNQHYVTYKAGISFPPQVIAGSGGNKLDTEILTSLPADQVLLARSVFGYVSVNVTKKELSLKFEEVSYDPLYPRAKPEEEIENFTISKKERNRRERTL